MKPPPFEYAAPGTVEEAVALLARGEGEAMLLAGGQSLVPLLAMRLARPALLVDLRRIGSLVGIREEGQTLVVGAMTSKRELERSELVARSQPLLRAATQLIGHPPIRTRGTVGGSLAQADPAAEYPALAVLLDAELRALGPAGARSIAAGDFFLGPLTTALGPAEVLVEARWPVLAPRTGWSIQEIARRHGDFALVGAVATLALDARGSVERTRLVLFGVRATPLRAEAAERLLAGQRPDAEALGRAARAAAEAIEEPLEDVHASADYRRHLAGVVAARALAEAAARAGEVARA
ncbi:MAG: FAD binding domain-containing protein [Deltaproteobacteria bacterium]|nr:FAD binding domain-containing protein [Deltaproteobacteria bacterium]